jgi:hypothetical protein
LVLNSLHNSKLVPVTVSGRITDDGSGVDPDTATYEVMDDSGLIHLSGLVSVGSDGRYAFTIPLQASRRGDDPDGRQYTIIVSATDTAGNEESATTDVTVPHDQRQGQSIPAR